MDLNIGKALEYSALGIAIVFAMIIVLMIVVKIMTSVVRNTLKKAKAPAGTDADGIAAEGKTTQKNEPAPGSVGDVKLYNVSDRDAAMIMAIVADQMQVPLNELRFLSIREVKEDEV